jgi:pimeloyl-ACP methyl ester carboxylesterase
MTSNEGPRRLGSPVVDMIDVRLRTRSLRLARTLHGPGFALDEEHVRRIAARSFDRGYSPGGWHRQLVAIWTGGNRHAALTRVRVPSVVIHGDADPLLAVEGGRDPAAAIPGARLLVIPGMGHELPRPVWPRVIGAIVEVAHRGSR